MVVHTNADNSKHTDDACGAAVTGDRLWSRVTFWQVARSTDDSAASWTEGEDGEKAVSPMPLGSMALRIDSNYSISQLTSGTADPDGWLIGISMEDANVADGCYRQ